jgi:hypothetical protein
MENVIFKAYLTLLLVFEAQTKVFCKWELSFLAMKDLKWDPPLPDGPIGFQF